MESAVVVNEVLSKEFPELMNKFRKDTQFESLNSETLSDADLRPPDQNALQSIYKDAMADAEAQMLKYANIKISFRSLSNEGFSWFKPREDISYEINVPLYIGNKIINFRSI